MGFSVVNDPYDPAPSGPLTMAAVRSLLPYETLHRESVAGLTQASFDCGTFKDFSTVRLMFSAMRRPSASTFGTIVYPRMAGAASTTGYQTIQYLSGGTSSQTGNPLTNNLSFPWSAPDAYPYEGWMDFCLHTNNYLRVFDKSFGFSASSSYSMVERQSYLGFPSATEGDELSLNLTWSSAMETGQIMILGVRR